jgi:hypothetical protein
MKMDEEILTFDDWRKLAEKNLSRNSPVETIISFLRKLLEINPDPIMEGRALEIIGRKTEISMKELRKAYDKIKKEEVGKAGEAERTEGKRRIIRASGKSDERIYEAVLKDGKPCFVVYDGAKFDFLESIETETETIVPTEKQEIPYIPYEWYDGEIDGKELYEEVFRVFHRFMDAPVETKERWTTEVFLTYDQDKFMTLPYDLLTGAGDSGKTHLLTIFSYLAYRPLFGVSIPPADIYTFLEFHSIATIIEDQIEGIENNVEKKKIYLQGYKRGAVIPRMFVLPSGRRIIVYYPCFGFKLAASRKIIKNDELMERFIVTKMEKGDPEKDEFLPEDIEQFKQLRNKLLKWRMLNAFRPLPEVNVPLSGRLKELWKPLIQVALPFDREKVILKQSLEMQKEKISDEESGLGSYITQAVLKAIQEVDDEYVPAETIWNSLVTILDGILDEKKSYVFHSSDFGDVTKQLLGYRLRELLGAKKTTKRIEEKVVKCYSFEDERLRKAINRYFCCKVTKFSTTKGGVHNKNKILIFCPFYEEKNNEKRCNLSTDTPYSGCKLSNLVTVNNSQADVKAEQDKPTEELAGLTDLTPQTIKAEQPQIPVKGLTIFTPIRPYYSICSYCNEKRELRWKDKNGNHLCDECKRNEESLIRKETSKKCYKCGSTTNLSQTEDCITGRPLWICSKCLEEAQYE